MRRLILLAALALGATAVQAENGVFYLGAGVTNGSLTDTSNGVATDLKNYIDLGSGSNSPFSNTQIITTHADASAWAAYVVGFLPVSLPVVDFYAKAGFARWKLNSNYTQYDPNFPNSVYTTSSSSTGSDFAWGIGVQARFSIVGVRLEYEGLDVHSNYTQVASLSLFLNL
jgi:hypothetical protein